MATWGWLTASFLGGIIIGFIGGWIVRAKIK